MSSGSVWKNNAHVTLDSNPGPQRWKARKVPTCQPDLHRWVQSGVSAQDFGTLPIKKNLSQAWVHYAPLLPSLQLANGQVSHASFPPCYPPCKVPMGEYLMHLFPLVTLLARCWWASTSCIFPPCYPPCKVLMGEYLMHLSPLLLSLQGADGQVPHASFPPCYPPCKVPMGEYLMNIFPHVTLLARCWWASTSCIFSPMLPSLQGADGRVSHASFPLVTLLARCWWASISCIFSPPCYPPCKVPMGEYLMHLFPLVTLLARCQWASTSCIFSPLLPSLQGANGWVPHASFPPLLPSLQGANGWVPLASFPPLLPSLQGANGWVPHASFPTCYPPCKVPMGEYLMQDPNALKMLLNMAGSNATVDRMTNWLKRQYYRATLIAASAGSVWVCGSYHYKSSLHVSKGNLLGKAPFQNYSGIIWGEVALQLIFQPAKHLQAVQIYWV